MKIGASMLATIDMAIENAIEYFDNNKDIEYFEICPDYPYGDINENKELLDLLNSYSLKYSIHAPLIDTNIASLSSAITRASIEEMKRSIDLACELDSDIVVIHPGKISFQAIGKEELVYEKAKDSLREIGKYAKDCGVKPCIENMPDIEGFMFKDINHLNRILIELDLPMTLDIGHAHHVGFNYDEVYFDCVKHIHVHNNYGDDDSHNALNEGTFNAKGFLDIFSNKKYNDIYMIEVYTIESIEKSIDYIKSLGYL